MPEMLVADERRARAGPGHPFSERLRVSRGGPAPGLASPRALHRARSRARTHTQPDASGCPPFRQKRDRASGDRFARHDLADPAIAMARGCRFIGVVCRV